MGYHRFPELSLYWEQQPDTVFGLELIQQYRTRTFQISFQNTHIQTRQLLKLKRTNGPRESLMGHSMRIHRIESAAISPIFLKFDVCVKEHHPIWSLKGFFFILIREKVMEF
jgi:hypothetical protein